jgi:hypothetical protein
MCAFPGLGFSLFSLAWRGAAWRPPQARQDRAACQHRTAGMRALAGRSARPASGHGPGSAEMVVSLQLRPAGRGIAADSTAGGTAATYRGATGPGGPGGGRVPVPRHDLAEGPEPGVGLLASGAGQPAEGIDAPAGLDRAGPDVGLAQRCRIGMEGDARTHLAPHQRHPQLITDHGPHGSPGRASGRGRGSGPGGGSGGTGPGGNGERGRDNAPGEGLWPGAAIGWLGTAIAGRHGVARAG